MASGDLPAVARRRVRLALREAREARLLTQSDVAEAMEWSLSKVMRIESGEVTISVNDLRPLLAYLDIADKARIDALVQDARISRRRQMWWDDPRYKDHLTPATRQLVQYEVQASAVRHFNTTIIPGRLQTRTYADAILRKYGDQLSQEDLDIRLEVRMRRRTELLSRKDRPDIRLLLDESVLHRRIGGAQAMGEQLADLSKLVNERRVRVRIVPFDMEDAPIPMLGSYEILHLGGEGDAVMYVESLLVDQVTEDQTHIKRNSDFFEQLWDAALDESDSLARLDAGAKSLLSSTGAKTPG